MVNRNDGNGMFEVASMLSRRCTVMIENSLHYRPRKHGTRVNAPRAAIALWPSLLLKSLACFRGLEIAENCVIAESRESMAPMTPYGTNGIHARFHVRGFIPSEARRRASSMRCFSMRA